MDVALFEKEAKCSFPSERLYFFLTGAPYSFFCCFLQRTDRDAEILLLLLLRFISALFFYLMDKVETVEANCNEV